MKTGSAVGRLKIGRLGLDIFVVEGTDHESLKKGPGHYVDSGLPGQGKLIYIAGHRTTYLAPFARINDIRNGDYMTLEVPYGTFEYRAVRHYIVPSNDLAVLRNGWSRDLAPAGVSSPVLRDPPLPRRRGARLVHARRDEHALPGAQPRLIVDEFAIDAQDERLCPRVLVRIEVPGSGERRQALEFGDDVRRR